MANYQQKPPTDQQFLEEMKKQLGTEVYNSLLENDRDELIIADAIKGLLAYLMNIGQGKEKKENISSSQLRNIYSKIRKVNKIPELYLIRPKLAYVYGRPNTKLEMQKLLILIDDLIRNVKNENQLKKFKEFFEAVIAYHKFYGGIN